LSLRFVSYTLRDEVLSPRDLAAAQELLGHDGADVYVDLLAKRSPFPQLQLQETLRNATSLHLLQTPAIFASPWVQRELHLATARGIPIFMLTTAVVPRARCGTKPGASVFGCRVIGELVRSPTHRSGATHDATIVANGRGGDARHGGAQQGPAGGG
jgi:hypothetical protein